MDRKNWRMWENYIILNLGQLNFFKALTGVRELIRNEKTERINVNLVLKLCDTFLKCFVTKKVEAREFNMAKKQLYGFFDQYTEIVAKDYQVYKLFCRIFTVLKEPYDLRKEYKLKEIRSIQYQPNWEKTM